MFEKLTALVAVAFASCAHHSATADFARADAAPAALPMTAQPPGSAPQEVEWQKVTVPGLGVMRAAVARPDGPGPFPTLIILHGSHGFAQQYVDLALDMARRGVLSVAACWFSGGSGAGSRFITPIECPEAPRPAAASSPAALRSLDALVKAVRTFPGVRADRVALFGHSRGGGAVLNYVLAEGGVQAAVLNSAGYPKELAGRVADLRVPILMLHGTLDHPSDGGSALTDVRMARAFEVALRRARRPVDAVYYNGGHNSFFTSAAQREDEVQRIAAFLRRHVIDRTR